MPGDGNEKNNELLDIYVNSPEIVRLAKFDIPMAFPDQKSRVTYYGIVDPATDEFIFTQFLHKLRTDPRVDIQSMSDEITIAMSVVAQAGVIGFGPKELLRQESVGEYGHCIAAFSNVGTFDIDDKTQQDLLRAARKGRTKESPQPRLYCVMLDTETLIVGGGGVKTTRTFQENPHLALEVQRLTILREKLKPVLELPSADAVEHYLMSKTFDLTEAIE